MNLQRMMYQAFEDLTSAGQGLEVIDFGNTILDGWWVRMSILLGIETAHTVTGDNIMGFGLKPVPTDVEITQKVTGALFQDDIYEDYLASTRDASWYHLNSSHSPLFYILFPRGVFDADDQIEIKKLFRKGAFSGQDIKFYGWSRTLADAADTASLFSIKLELEFVVAPNEWGPQ